MKVLTLILSFMLLGASLVALDFNLVDEAVANDDFDGFKRLLTEKKAITQKNPEKYTIIQWLSGRANLKYIKYLVSLGASVKDPVTEDNDNYPGYSPLMMAARFGEPDIIPYYLSLGADINYVSKAGESLMSVACEIGNLALVKQLLPLVKDKNGIGTMSYIHTAVQSENIALATFLINNGSDPNFDKNGSYGLQHTLAGGSAPEIFKLLLTKKMNWELETQWGATPILIAASGSVNVVRELLKKKVNLAVYDTYTHQDPIQTAIAAGNLFNVQQFIDAGVDANKANKGNGKTAIQFAREAGKDYMIPILQKKKRIKIPSWTLDDDIKSGLVLTYVDNGQLELRDADGQKSNLGDFKGTVVLMNVWATWCPPCRTELPSIQQLYSRNREKGLEVIAQSIDSDIGVAKGFIESLGLDLPLYWADANFTQTKSPYQATQYPTTYVLDKNGFSVARKIGAIDWSTPDVQRFFDMAEAIELR